VPEDFAFALKASRRITHQLQLRDAADPLGYLVDTAATLEGRLGPLLFQLPPHLKKDRELLADFLALLPPGARAAFEFRHPTWFDDGVYETLAAARAALVVSDQGAEDPPVVPGATFGYARLRREDYDDAALAAWAGRFAAAGWEELFVFFKHEESGAGPALAERFSRIYGERNEAAAESGHGVRPAPGRRRETSEGEGGKR
jgi:uncharacterized protein YecE (DUF72 family)